LIPLVDLARQHAEIAAEVNLGWQGVLDHGRFIRGPEVAEFEQAFAAYMGTAHCVGVASGTDALELAMRTLDIGPGDEVVVPANTFIASVLAVMRAGASPILVDCDPDTYLVDVDAAADAASRPAVKAVMPVHLYGQAADVDGLRARLADLPIIEDAAQAQGARRHGTPAGALGTVAGTSFYPGKNIGAYGDAGAVLTDDDELARRVRALGNWGSEEKYHHPEVGFNSRLDTLQAVVLSAKLRRLEEWNQWRRRAAHTYGEMLGDDPDITLPAVLPGNEPVWHLYVIRVPRRDLVREKMAADGVETGIHYPLPVHLHGATSALGYSRGDFPVAESISDQILSLPMYPGITDSELEIVAASLQAAVRS
jgi:dTDP-4-amino-4,6-dideoxygalactose transaminase